MFEWMNEGKIDVVVEPGRQWRVKYSGTYWPAKSYNLRNLWPGDLIKVVGRQGIFLIIEPA